MPTLVTPTSLLVHHARQFLEQLPAIREGDVTAIHDARVATRRIRELLPLVDEEASGGRLLEVSVEATRRLGRVRDADVTLELLASVEGGVPDAAAEVASLRQRWEGKRQRAVKNVIKALEKLEAGQVLRDAVHDLSESSRVRPITAQLRRQLDAQILDRSWAVSQAMEHAGGIMFPNRLHEVRIAVKKLRYAVEIAVETGRSELQDSIADLKKAQEALGKLHDHDVLAAVLRKEHATRVLPLVDHHRRGLHQKYLRQRPALTQMVTVLTSQAIHAPREVSVGRAALAALPLVLLMVPILRRRPSPQSRVLASRVPVRQVPLSQPAGEFTGVNGQHLAGVSAHDTEKADETVGRR